MKSYVTILAEAIGGHPARPLTRAWLYASFADCLDAGASDIPARELTAI